MMNALWLPFNHRRRYTTYPKESIQQPYSDYVWCQVGTRLTGAITL